MLAGGLAAPLPAAAAPLPAALATAPAAAALLPALPLLAAGVPAAPLDVVGALDAGSVDCAGGLAAPPALAAVLGVLGALLAGRPAAGAPLAVGVGVLLGAPAVELVGVAAALVEVPGSVAVSEHPIASTTSAVARERWVWIVFT